MLPFATSRDQSISALATVLRRGFGNSRLRLSRQSFVQRRRVERILHALAQNVDNVNARVRRGAGVVVSARGTEREPAGGAAAGGGARVGKIRWRA